MSVSTISSASPNVYQSSNQQPGMRSYIRQLGQALQSGDLSGAQQAYASLSQLPQFQMAQNNAGSSVQGTDFIQTLTQVGSDLQSGDLASAQQAFSSLQPSGQGAAQANAADPTGQPQGLGGHHHHHHHASAISDAFSASPSSDPDSPGSSASTDPLLSMLTTIQTDLANGSNSDIYNAAGNGNTTTNPTPSVDILT